MKHQICGSLLFDGIDHVGQHRQVGLISTHENAHGGDAAGQSRPNSHFAFQGEVVKDPSGLRAEPALV